MFDSYLNCLLITLLMSVVWNLFAVSYFGQRYINMYKMQPRGFMILGCILSLTFASLFLWWFGAWYFYAGLACMVPFFFFLKKVLSCPIFA